MSSTSYSKSSLLHEHDPTMDARIVHAVNVSNKKEISQLKHKAKSLEGSRDVSMHIYRQEEKDLVKHLFKLQQEKQRRHPEINLARRHSIDVPDAEYLINSLHFHHGGSASDHKPVTESHASILEQYTTDPIYQPVGYGHESQEYVGVPQDITEKRKQSEPDGRFGGSHTTSQTTLSHPAIANALPSRHQINVGVHPDRQHSSKTMAFLEPESQLKKGSLAQLDNQHEQEQGVGGGPGKQYEQKSQFASRESNVNLKNEDGDNHATDGVTKERTARPKRKVVMFDVASSSHSSPVNHESPLETATSEQSEVGTSHTSTEVTALPMTQTQTSSLECIYDEPYETEAERRYSISKALIDQEHQKVDSLMDIFRTAFPVKKELDWQKTHPRRGPQRGPFVAHTPPQQVTSKDLSSEGENSRLHRHDSHGASHSDGEHSGTRIGHGRLSGSHANISQHRHSNGSPRSTPHESHANISRIRQSHFNVTQKSHSKIDPTFSSSSQNTVGTSLYNLPKEALDDYRNLMQQASHAAHHPSARESHVLQHNRHADIPHAHHLKASVRKARQKLLALHLLAEQKKQNSNKPTPMTKIDPEETLMCRYLRLSSLNIETLVDMCNEAGVVVGIHPHMSIDDVAKYVFEENLVGDGISGQENSSIDKSKENIGIPKHEHVNVAESSQKK